jgi:site-specific recombinase XerD
MQSPETGVVEIIFPGADRAPAMVSEGVRERIAAHWFLAQDNSNTEQAYRRDIAMFFAWCDEFGIDTLTARRADMDAYRRYLDTGGAGRPYSKPTIGRKLSAVSSFYRHGNREFEHLVPANPADNIKRPKIGHQSTTESLDIEELRRLIDQADASSPRDSALVRMLAYTAVRISELCTAHTSDLSTYRGHRVLTVTRKGGERGLVVIPPSAAVALDKHLASRRGYLFLDRDGSSPLPRKVAAYHVTRLSRVAGIDKRITPHSLRHTFATVALDAGEDIREVQRALGHKRIETTMRYEHSRTNVDRSPAHALARVVQR